MIAIEERHLNIIKNILKQYPYTFYAFGSRFALFASLRLRAFALNPPVDVSTNPLLLTPHPVIAFMSHIVLRTVTPSFSAAVLRNLSPVSSEQLSCRASAKAKRLLRLTFEYFPAN